MIRRMLIVFVTSLAAGFSLAAFALLVHSSVFELAMAEPLVRLALTAHTMICFLAGFMLGLWVITKKEP